MSASSSLHGGSVLHLSCRVGSKNLNKHVTFKEPYAFEEMSTNEWKDLREDESKRELLRKRYTPLQVFTRDIIAFVGTNPRLISDYAVVEQRVLDVLHDYVEEIAENLEHYKAEAEEAGADKEDEDEGDDDEDEDDECGDDGAAEAEDGEEYECSDDEGQYKKAKTKTNSQYILREVLHCVNHKAGFNLVSIFLNDDWAFNVADNFDEIIGSIRHRRLIAIVANEAARLK